MTENKLHKVSLTFLGEYNQTYQTHTSCYYCLELTLCYLTSVFFKRLAPIGALFSQMNRTYNTIYNNKFLPPPGFEPRSLGTVSRLFD